MALRYCLTFLFALGVGAPGCSSSSDDVGPSVVSSSPGDGDNGVEPGASVEIVFDRDVDADTLAAAVTIAPSTPFTVFWRAADRTAVITTSQPLANDIDYRVDISTAVTGANGLPLRAAYGFEFSVRPAVTCAPTDTTRYQRGDDVATVAVAGTSLRTYTIASNATFRDGLPTSGNVVITEGSDRMRLRSGHSLFDALFAMARHEVEQASVSEIRNGDFNGGGPIACDCFETGEKWTYVWTRDTAYAVDLALALVDPSRARNSLEFKLSERKASVGGGDRQIVQDTGSGGSYPISTDRVVWALGARELLRYLHGAERTAFRDLAYEAVRNTIEYDRTMVFDANDGLYRGEQSFLDWREQSYPIWTAQDTSHIAMSKSLSTNLGHLAAIELAAELATERQDTADATRYESWAAELRLALHRELWRPDDDAYSAMKTTGLDPTPARKRDLLGESLAVLHRVPGAEDAGAAVASYARSSAGPPVLWPQLPDVPVYHNRGTWPFVTAYSVLAARSVGNAAVVDRELEALVAGAALHLSNMENFDFATADATNTQVNSRRQLWSVAGYLAVIIKGVFGLESSADGFRFRPAISGAQRRRWFGATNEIVLHALPFRDNRVEVRVSVPDCGSSTGMLTVANVWVDGVEVGDRWLSGDELAAATVINIALVDTNTAPGRENLIADPTDPAQVIAPREPAITDITIGNDRPVLTIDTNGETGVEIAIHRDGVRVATGVTGSTWTDAQASDHATRTYCYAVESARGGLHSHHSQPRCYWGPSFERVNEIDATQFTAVGGSFTTANGRPHYEGWGATTDTLELSFQPTVTAEYYLQTIYANGAGPVSTGVTAAVKTITVSDGGTVMGGGTLIMPQRGDWTTWAESTLVPVSLTAGTTYTITIADGVNMSYFDHFTSYAHSGGGSDPFNAVDIAAVRILQVR